MIPPTRHNSPRKSPKICVRIFNPCDYKFYKTSQFTRVMNGFFSGTIGTEILPKSYTKLGTCIKFKLKAMTLNNRRLFNPKVATKYPYHSIHDGSLNCSERFQESPFLTLCENI